MIAPKPQVLTSKEQAYSLLDSLGAPQRLLDHVRLVGEAAEELVDGLKLLGVDFRAEFVRLGVAIHDAGKILHPEELSAEGSEHEAAGVDLLLKHGVQPEIARCCISHARYDSMEVSFEELLIALSDKLWKGKRVAALELRVIDEAANQLDKTRWDLFEKLDSCFEGIAAKGDERLARSSVDVGQAP